MDSPIKSGSPTEARSAAACWVWGVPLVPLTFDETISAIERLMLSSSANYVITANLHYAMLSSRDSRLQRHNDQAALVVADGMPLVWASRWRNIPLPERVAGADLFPALCGLAAKKGYRVYLLGAGPGAGELAANNLKQRFPALQVVGVACPPFRELSNDESQELIEGIRSAKPHLLFVAFGQPKGEYWVSDNYVRLEVPVMIQVGASIDFAAGNIRRAPNWMRRIGLEWFFRLAVEPRRMVGRYSSNFLFAVRMLLRDLFTKKRDRR